ncbi:hypothetical protein LPJ61_003503 [Coemansia biformis]|uniref:F-box domain-containing protein n=1 Tax=Coemansia biformis TaxID=1286918 RepID=A0A9W7Y6G8_9FUNG|nr:hypothetical protein LPJ61_003503 [Coemansia biformis]
MPVYPPAQALPLLVLEAIFRHVLSAPPAIPTLECDRNPPTKQVALLPIMSQCRAWRSVAAAIFYRSAKMWPEQLVASDSHKKKHLSLSDIIATGTHCYLRELIIHVYIPDFAKSWEAGQNLGATLSGSGDLGSVSRLELTITADVGLGHSCAQSNEGEPDRELVDKNVKIFAKQIRHALPNAQSVSVYHSVRYPRLGTAKFEDECVLSNMDQLVGPNPVRLSLDRMPITKQFVNGLSETTLRSITISMHTGTQQHVELVRRNAASLERLRINRSTHFSVIKMTCDSRDRNSTLVYPRLECLHISMLTGSRGANMRNPLADPFPRLHTLISRGYFPFRTPGVLVGGKSHIRHLDIDMDAGLQVMLKDCNAFDKGAFSKLQYVSLGWATSGAVWGDYSEQLCQMSTEMCAQTRVVRMPNTHIRHMAKLTPTFEYARQLEILDVPHCEFTIDQCIAMLCGCPRLIKANVGLIELSSVTDKRMPPVEVLQEYQEKYKACTSGVRALGIRNTRFGSARQAGECLVLLADILPSIKRVTVSLSSKRSVSKILRAITLASKRPVYKGHRLHKEVEFSSGHCW